MKRSTHNRLTKGLLPWVDPKVIDKVNKALDSPDPVGKLVSVFSGAAAKEDRRLALGIDRIGHRSANHDLVSAVMAGYSVAGYIGALCT